MEHNASSRIAHLLIMAAPVAILGVSPAFSARPPQEMPQSNQWKMVYEAGVAPLKLQSSVMVAIGDENLVLQSKKGPSFSIRATNITAVSSTLVSRRTAAHDAASVYLGAVEGSGGSPYGVLLFLPLLTGAAVTYPIKSHYAYVSILWSEKGTEQEVLLKLSRRDYTPFLAELRKATGKEWKNLDTEWERVQQELKREGANKFSLRLDHKVRIVKSDLKPGAYQLVLLEREANHGELYFFPGNHIDIEHLAAVVVVEIESMANDTETELARLSHEV